MMFTKTKAGRNTLSHDAPRTLLLIAHAHVFTFIEGWNELKEEKEIFSFSGHAFNFDYLLHVSGINYLIHPDDVPQIIQLIQQGVSELVQFNFRFINRSGEIRTLVGLARLVPRI
ncbi:MAG: hypothetical protein JNK18_06995 [Cyclobacteriaceae bacterium]|nr:hypothetical protein [Cyclobacteriaceae bacterium]